MCLMQHDALLEVHVLSSDRRACGSARGTVIWVLCWGTCDMCPLHPPKMIKESDVKI